MTEQIRIRTMQPKDIARCVQMMVHTPLWKRYSITPQKTEADFAGALAGGADLFVAIIEEQAVGCVWCVARGAFDRSGYIRLLVVDAAYRSRGLGGKLLDHAEAFLSQGAEDVFLLVSDFNHAAQRFYRRHGYVQVGALPGYVMPDITERIYRKCLSAGPAGGDQAHRAGHRQAN